jgi:DNA-binding Lrp family transcriptional regulator
MLDRLNRKILTILAQNGRISWKELGQSVGLSETPTLRRVRALEAAGYIDGYSARINEAAVGTPISVFVSISMDRQNEEELAVFEGAIAGAPQIVSCYMLAGDVDYILRVAVADVQEFQEFLAKVLRPIPGMRRISSSFALKSIIQRSTPPLD